MEVLEQFDVDFDFPAGRLRLWKPHTVESVAKKNNLASIDALVVNETLLLGFRLVNALSTKDSSGDGVATQPFLGVVDCGASFSVVNWQAAKLLGLPSQNDGSWRKKPAVTGVGSVLDWSLDSKYKDQLMFMIGFQYCYTRKHIPSILLLTKAKIR